MEQTTVRRVYKRRLVEQPASIQTQTKQPGKSKVCASLHLERTLGFLSLSTYLDDQEDA